MEGQLKHFLNEWTNITDNAYVVAHLNLTRSHLGAYHGPLRMKASQAPQNSS